MGSSEDGGGFGLKDGCVHGGSSFASVEKGMLVKNGNTISYFVMDFGAVSENSKGLR